MECGTCMWWAGLAARLARAGAGLAGQNASGEDAMRELQGAEAKMARDNKRLTKDNERLAKTNKRLNAKKNGIRTVPDKNRTSTGNVGGPRGTRPNRNTRPKRIDRKETVDIAKCSEGRRLSEKVTARYTRYAEVMHVWWENVEYTVNRRWCKECHRQVTAKIPGVAKHARVSANYAAAASAAHMGGLSHGMAADYCTDVLKRKASRSWSYRNKISTARRLKPEYHTIRREILDEPYLACDGPWQNIMGQNGGKVLVARGENTCLAEVAWSANKEAVKKMLPRYAGVVGQDSNTIWLPTGGDHQLCMQHQRRLSKKDLLHRNLEAAVKKFLEGLRRLDYLHHMYDEIGDPHARIVAAGRLEKTRSELLNAEYEDDGEGSITKRKKRHRREGYFMTTHMYKKRDGVAADSNGVARVNRRFAAVRGDGGGNRTQNGMDANSILFTIYATDWINGNSFFDHPVRSASGDGQRAGPPNHSGRRRRATGHARLPGSGGGGRRASKSETVTHHSIYNE